MLQTVWHSVSMGPLVVVLGISVSNGIFHLIKNVKQLYCVLEAVLDMLHWSLYVDTCHLYDIGFLHWGKYVRNS